MRHGQPIRLTAVLLAGLSSVAIVGCTASAAPSPSAPVATAQIATPSITPSTPSATASVPASSPSSPAAGASQASGLLPISAGLLPAGAYTTTAFQPTLHFRLADGWNSLFPDDPDEIAFDAADGTGFMAITRVSKVVDAKGTVPVPDDIIGWLAANPHFTWSGAPVPVTIGGVAGAMIDGKVKAGLEPTDVFAYDTGNMKVLGGDHMRYYVVPLEGPDLTIVLARLGGDDGFEKVLESAQATLDSLEIAAD